MYVCMYVCKSCIQQRNTTCLLSIWISLACARASKLTTTNMYIARARCESQLTVGQVGWMLADHRDGLSSSSFSLILDSSVGLSASIQSAGELVFKSCIQQRNKTCLLSIWISLACARASKLKTTNMYIARARCESQLTVGQVGWMLADHRDGLSSSSFSLILDSSVGLSASIQSAGELVSGAPGSNPAFSRGTQLVSFRFEYRLPVPEHRN